MASGFLIKYNDLYLAKDLYNDHFDYTTDITAALVVPEEFVYQVVDSFCQRKGQRKALLVPQDFDLIWIDDDSLLLNNLNSTSNETDNQPDRETTDHGQRHRENPMSNQPTIRWIPTPQWYEEENPDQQETDNPID